ncbi:MAG: hypothetical protein QOE83_1003 [Actinomycetota bacterium]|jgi:hypothetical protein|nr:hypothetical protein [Actinomycetota bacterium]
MDEFDLVRRALSGDPEGPGARERARERLLAAIRDEGTAGRKRRRPRVFVAGLAACLAVLTLVAFSIALVDQPPAAAQELHRLAQIAAHKPVLKMGPGQFVLMRSEELRQERSQFLGTGISFTMLDRLSIQTWIAADGSGYRQTTVGAVRFASEQDRAAWVTDGKPPLPAPGDVRTERYSPADAPWFDASSLPSDANRLEASLRADPSLTNDGQIYDQIGTYLAQGDSRPLVRAALFEVASRLDGIQLLGTKDDPRGRPGTALAIDTNGERVELIFDPNSSQLLAINTYDLLPDDSVGPITSWAAFEPTQVVDTAPAAESRS